MKKPESLNTITVAQTREKYRNNQKSLDNMMYLVATGIYEEIKGVAGESIINQVMTEILVQQEYIREREIERRQRMLEMLMKSPEGAECVLGGYGKDVWCSGSGLVHL